jgi:hypothetical protein
MPSGQGYERADGDADKCRRAEKEEQKRFQRDGSGDACPHPWTAVVLVVRGGAFS